MKRLAPPRPVGELDDITLEARAGVALVAEIRRLLESRVVAMSAAQQREVADDLAVLQALASRCSEALARVRALERISARREARAPDLADRAAGQPPLDNLIAE